MKLSTVVNAIPVISKLMSKELPVIQSYEVAKLARRIDEETKLYNEQRQKLLQKYGDQDGEKYVIRPENVDVCNGELEELLNIDVDIPEKIDILSTNVALTPAEMIAIEDFLAE